MANNAVKSLVRANAARLRQLRQLILAANAVHLLLRAGVYHATFDRSAAALAAAFAALYAGPYAFLAWAARPVRGAAGAVVQAGEDLSAPGVLEYAHDVVYLTALAHTAAVFTPYAVLVLAAIPLFVACSLCARCCGGGGGAEGGAAEAGRGPPPGGVSRRDRRRAGGGGGKQR